MDRGLIEMFYNTVCPRSAVLNVVFYKLSGRLVWVWKKEII